MQLAKKFKSYNDGIYTVFLLQLLRVPSSPLLTYFCFYIHLQVTIGIIIRDCEAIFFLIIESVPREHSSSSLEITYCTCTVSGAGFTLYMLYIAECTVHTELVLCPVLCTAFVVYSTVQYVHYTVSGAVLTCLAWLVRGPTSCG